MSSRAISGRRRRGRRAAYSGMSSARRVGRPVAEHNILPPHNGSITLSKKFRYQMNVDSASGVQVANFDYTNNAGLMLAYSAFLTTTTFTALPISVRLVAVEMFGATSATGSYVACEFATGSTAQIGSPSAYYEDVAMGVAAAHIRVVPPEGSMAAAWQNGQASAASFQMFTVWGAAGTFIDVTLEIVLADTQTAGSHSSSTTRTAGAIASGWLDGTHHISPWDYQTL